MSRINARLTSLERNRAECEQLASEIRALLEQLIEEGGDLMDIPAIRALAMEEPPGRLGHGARVLDRPNPLTAEGDRHGPAHR